MTITAPTVAVAIFAPFIGRLADRLGFRRVIVALGLDADARDRARRDLAQASIS